jgi:hypothetical protein
MIRSLIRILALSAGLFAGCNMALADSAKLVDGFDGSDFAREGGLYYKDNAEQKAGVVEFQKDVVRSGAGALKLSVKPTCPAGDEDCSERAEIWERTKLRPPYDEGVWYGFAVKFAEPIPQDDHRYLIAQWKREIDPGAEGDFSPFLALRLRNGKLFATVETNFRPGLEGASMTGPGICAPKGVPVYLRPDTNQMRALVAADANWKVEDGDYFEGCTDAITVTEHGKMPTPDSGWIDFAILTKPGADGSGHIEIFANGKPVVTVKGMIGHNDKGLGKNQYFKFGPYRAGQSTDWSVYYDDFRRSPDCADVLKDGACPVGG